MAGDDAVRGLDGVIQIGLEDAKSEREVGDSLHGDQLSGRDHSLRTMAQTNYLPIPSQLLWYKMMNYFNRSGWSSWVIVDNLRLMAAMSMGREATFIKARDELIKAGRIIYQKGRKGSPNKYKMVYFTSKT